LEPKRANVLFDGKLLSFRAFIFISVATGKTTEFTRKGNEFLD